jgi:DNA uptake protein ComE-like DNA-binding protein
MSALAAGAATFGITAAATLLVSAPAFPQEATRLNPNTATAEELAVVPGLDRTLAAAIQEQRPFPSILEFDALVRKTLSEEAAKRLYERVFVPVNLNTGTEEQIKLIPGMTSRMVHEFLEYRPYADIETFNREIGKYVDEAEVARLRSYVTL